MEKFFSENVVEAIKYILKFKDKIFVIKLGGEQISNKYVFNNICENIKILNSIGIKMVLVHGGGKEISERLDYAGIKSEFYGGYRKTDKDSIVEIEMVLSGKINKSITLKLNNLGVTAVGVNGKDGGMIKCSKKIINTRDLGLVGEIKKLNLNLINLLLKEDILPVISPIGFNNDGETFNINADTLAAGLAKELKCEKLIFITDVDGYIRNFENNGELVSKISSKELIRELNENKISGGMKPKLECALEAVLYTKKTAHIINGKKPNSLLIEILSDDGIGSMITY